MFKEEQLLKTDEHGKKPYETAELQLFVFEKDVMLASSSFGTKGEYDDIGGWEVLGSKTGL